MEELSTDRGFEAFVGKTVKEVDTKAIDVIKILFTDGSKYEIWAEKQYYGIPVITAEKA